MKEKEGESERGEVRERGSEGQSRKRTKWWRKRMEGERKGVKEN